MVVVRITSEVVENTNELSFGERQRVIEAIAVSGPELLREAAEQAAKEWVFKPATANRVRVKVQGLLTFNFTLQ